jgi:hypothetical protein
MRSKASHKLATASYATYEPWMGTPVQISRGRPRGFPHRYRRISELAPSREAFLIGDRAEFEVVYRLELEAVGVDVLVEKFEAIAADHDGAPCCMLCFCRLDQGAPWCHRQIAAAVLSEWFGPVPELP